MYSPTILIFFKSPPILLFNKANQSATQKVKVHPDRVHLLTLMDLKIPFGKLRIKNKYLSNMHSSTRFESIVTDYVLLLFQHILQFGFFDTFFSNAPDKFKAFVEGKVLSGNKQTKKRTFSIALLF